MRHALIGSLVTLGLLLGLSGALPAQTPIGALYGAQMACDPALTGCQKIPLTVTILCTTSCPRIMAPTWSIPTRFWGSVLGASPNCVTSSDSGVTWAGCTTQPFSSGTKEHYAGTADGAVVAVAQVGGNCVVKRSTDLGTTWPTVFTYAVTNGCGGSLLGDFFLKCLPTGDCVMPFINPGTQVLHGLRSTDNGQTWASQTTVAGAVCGGTAGTAYDGTNGIQALTATAPGTCKAPFTETAPPWALSVAWPDVGDCWGSVIYNSLPRAICFKTATGNYQMISRTGALVANLTLPSALLAIDVGGPSVSIGTNNLYLMATKSVPSGPAPIGIWISQDNLATFTLLATTGVSVNAMKDGSFFSAQGCLWFSAGTTPLVGKICP